jgi:hypothetical protein
MPEYQYPGVYVEEHDTAKPILGVSTSIDNLTTRSLASELREIVLRIDPDWTDHNTSDPGVTVLEVLAWIAETVIYRANAIPEQGRRAAERAAAALATLSEPCRQADAALTRPRFSPGQLLTAKDLQLEQNYHREKLRRHNRALLGAGIVAGLEVSVGATADAPDGRIHVAPGFAIDGCGNGFLRMSARPIDTWSGCDGFSMRWSRTAEGCTSTSSATMPAIASGSPTPTSSGSGSLRSRRNTTPPTSFA